MSKHTVNTRNKIENNKLKKTFYTLNCTYLSTHNKSNINITSAHIMNHAKINITSSEFLFQGPLQIMDPHRIPSKFETPYRVLSLSILFGQDFHIVGNKYCGMIFYIPREPIQAIYN